MRLLLGIHSHREKKVLDKRRFINSREWVPLDQQRFRIEPEHYLTRYSIAGGLRHQCSFQCETGEALKPKSSGNAGQCTYQPKSRPYRILLTPAKTLGERKKMNMSFKFLVFLSVMMLASVARAEKIDLSCTNNGGAGREDVVTFDSATKTLTWAQHPESPLQIKSMQKTQDGYVLRLPDTVVYIKGKESRIEVHSGNGVEKDPCHVISDLRKPTNAGSVATAPAAAPPPGQDSAKHQDWMFSAANETAYISSGVANDGLSRLVNTRGGDSRSVGFTFYPDGYHGHALNKVLDLEEPFIVEVRETPSTNHKFSMLAYFTGDGGWTQEARRHRTGSEASAFLDAFGQDGHLSLQTAKALRLPRGC